MQKRPWLVWCVAGRHIGYSVQVQHLAALLRHVAAQPRCELQRHVAQLRRNVLHVRASHFTFGGLRARLEQFFVEGASSAGLACAGLPPHPRCNSATFDRTGKVCKVD